MSEIQKRELVREALRRASADGVEPWGPGEPYANIFTCSNAIVNLYWSAIENPPA